MGNFMLRKKKIIIVICLVMLLPLSLFGNLIYQHYASQKDGIPILGYHGVVSDEEKKTMYADNRYFLSKSQFENQIKYLYDHQYQTLSMNELYDFYQGKTTKQEKSIVLTFDDGYKNFHTVVEPILKEYGFKGTCFVIGKHLKSSNQNMLKEKDIQNNQTVEYYSHSYNLHRTAPGFDRKIIQDMSLKEIEKDFAMNPIKATYFAFPYGRTRDDIEPILKENHVQLAFLYNQLRNMTQKDNPYQIPRYMIVDLMPDWYFQWIVK